MKLKPNVNIPAFIETVRACSGQVCFETPEGDNLNLKSALSQLVFTTVIARKPQSLNGWITVQNPQDEALLYDYCMYTADRQDL